MPPNAPYSQLDPEKRYGAGFIKKFQPKTCFLGWTKLRTGRLLPPIAASCPFGDENQQALLKDPLHIPVGPITRARSKKIIEALNGLIHDIWVDSTTGHSKLGPKEDEGVINLIQAIDGADHA